MKTIVVLSIFAMLVQCPQPVAAQTLTPEAARTIGEELHRGGILSEAGNELLKQRIAATASRSNGDIRPADSFLWRLPCSSKKNDTVFELSRASILTFLGDRLAGEFYYRSANKEELELMKELGIFGKSLSYSDTDTAAFHEHLKKLDSVVHLKHPGKSLEAAIAWNDRPLPGWHTFVIQEEQAADWEKMGHGHIADGLSVFGKTRTRLIRKLQYLNLIDNKTARKLIRRVRNNSDYLEFKVVRNAICPENAGSGNRVITEYLR